MRQGRQRHMPLMQGWCEAMGRKLRQLPTFRVLDVPIDERAGCGKGRNDRGR